MKKILAVAVAVIAVGASMFVTSTPAMAGPYDNNNAGIAGITPGGQQQFNDQECPSGYFCLWTKPYYEGKVFALKYCRTYAMSQWNGVGSWWNHNIDNSPGLLKNQNGSTIVNAPAYPASGSYNAAYNFSPVWFVTPCLW